MAFVNKMDIMGANFYNVIDMMKDRLGCTPVPLELPIGTEQDYVGNIDLLNMKALIYKDDVGKVIEEQEIDVYKRQVWNYGKGSRNKGKGLLSCYERDT